MFIEITDIESYFQASRLSELTSDSEGNTIDGLLEETVDFANSLIEVSLSDRYKLPLDSVPESIKDIGKSIVKYKLYERCDALTEFIVSQYNNSIKILNDFANGKKTIPNLPKTSKPVGMLVSKKTQVYTSEVLGKY